MEFNVIETTVKITCLKEMWVEKIFEHIAHRSSPADSSLYTTWLRSKHPRLDPSGPIITYRLGPHWSINHFLPMLTVKLAIGNLKHTNFPAQVNSKLMSIHGVDKYALTKISFSIVHYSVVIVLLDKINLQERRHFNIVKAVFMERRREGM